ncbi:MAG TPA: PQQ-dependent sugar dehydrogenase [Gemmatimonadales bacterium]|jgi:glucose/arabinose dehydrogenase|nr:PQQ-dependent sugar dehydrogenase [Gemmatimonadales bacterium]
MRTRTVVRIVVWGTTAALAVAVLWLRGCGARRQLGALKVPPGFTIALYADSVPNARSLALGDRGTVFVGSREGGVVYALVDSNRDGKADAVFPMLRGLRVPNGVAFTNGALYVAEVSRILRYDSIEARLRNPPPPVVVTDRLPREGHHGWRFIGVGPDGWLYVGSGAPCNICDPPGELFASILRLKRDGSGLEVFARGVRNSVGFDWNPITRELWFTDNGRDWLGPDEPPDELNRAPRAGVDFGFPHCHAGVVLDPDFGKGHRCADYAPPEQRLGPHVAALGMRFYTGTMFPPEYRGQIFIAEHGSWNRVIPVGYRLTLVRLVDGRPVAYEPFATGWLRAGAAWGRPVDVLVMPDGALLISDDRAGVVYRISYRER